MPISFRGSSVWAIELTTDIIVITNKKNCLLHIFLIFELILIFSAAKLHHIIEAAKKTTKIFSLHFEVSGKISIFVPAKSFF